MCLCFHNSSCFVICSPFVSSFCLMLKITMLCHIHWTRRIVPALFKDQVLLTLLWTPFRCSLTHEFVSIVFTISSLLINFIFFLRLCLLAKKPTRDINVRNLFLCSLLSQEISPQLYPLHSKKEKKMKRACSCLLYTFHSSYSTWIFLSFPPLH